MKSRLALATIALTLFCAPAWAQTAIQPGTIVGTFQGSSFGYASLIATLYTVPGDRAARITDIVATTFGAPPVASCLGVIQAGSNSLYFAVPPNTTLVIPLGTGIGVTAGNVVNLAQTNCDSSLFVQIRGYNFTIP